MEAFAFVPFLLFMGTRSKNRYFRIHAPIYAFEKAGAPEGQRRRIGGLITTDSKDRENEVVLQEGLDFSEFLHHGWFNDNHMKGMDGVIGEPDPSSLRFVKKGQVMPNGAPAPANGHWAEGWLYEGDPRADMVWGKIGALTKSPTGRKFGFSIEGKILERSPGKIAQALVRNVAVTHCPVNTDTSLVALAKALRGIDEPESPIEELAEEGVYYGDASVGPGEDLADVQAHAGLGNAAEDAEAVDMDGVIDMDLAAGRRAINPRFEPARAVPPVQQEKALSAGSASGRALQPESLEHDVRNATVSKSRVLTRGEAVDYVLQRYPQIDCATAGRVVDTLLRAKRGANRRKV